jgi:hypothetical protein
MADLVIPDDDYTLISEVNAMEADPKHPTLLMIASKDYDSRTPAYLLAKYPAHLRTINDKDDDGMTALMYAARAGRGETLALLKSNGADVTLKNNAGKTAVDIIAGLSDRMFDEDPNSARQELIQTLSGGRRRRRGGKKTRKVRKTRKTRKTRSTKPLR